MDRYTATEQAYKHGYEDGKPKWIPVSERLPEYGQEIIAYDGGVISPKVFAYHFWNKDYSSFQRITHWMLMPEPPKEGK